MKACITRNKYKAISVIIVLGGWWILSMIYQPLIVPPISAVAGKFMAIILDAASWREIGSTYLRMIIGLAMGISIGGILGLLSGLFSPVEHVWKPIMNVIQVIPPISWLVLAIIWFGYNGKASIFIVIMAIVPTISICVTDAIHDIDWKKVEMGNIFHLPKAKMLRYIYFPSVLPQFISGLKISIGAASKTVIMGEVLTTSTGIGGQITKARLNIEPETVIAWSIVAIIMFYFTVMVIKLLNRIYRSMLNVRN